MLERLRRAVRRHGVVKTIALVFSNLAYWARELVKPSAPDIEGMGIDHVLGIETTRVVEVGALHIESNNVQHAVRYQASEVELARSSLADCQIDYSEYSFIDYGCGKGRVLFLAAQHPFREIIGVEFSPELHKIALANLEAARPKIDPHGRLRVVLCDAANFQPPASPLVCYLYNPFGEPVVKAVVQNLEHSLEQTPRPVSIIYVDPVHEAVFTVSSCFRLAKREKRYVIFSNHRPCP
jgi:predicted RNA methylase